MTKQDHSQISNSDQNNMENDEIDLRELFSAIWQGKWIIICFTFLFSVSGVFYALSLPDEYQSTVLLAPATSSNSSISKLAGQYGGLASLAGINLGGGSTADKTTVALEIIKTWGFLENFIKQQDLHAALFAANGWNRNLNKILINPEVYDEENKKWLINADDGSDRVEPSSWQLYQKLKNRITINHDKTTGLIHLSVEYYSPFLAKDWTDKLVQAINMHIQKQDREEARRNIDYLQSKIKETTVNDMQAVFYQLIEEQTKSLMLAEVNDEYVFKVLSPAKVSEVKSRPKRAFIVVLWFFLGAGLSIVMVVIYQFVLKQK